MSSLFNRFKNMANVATKTVGDVYRRNISNKKKPSVTNEQNNQKQPAQPAQPSQPPTSSDTQINDKASCNKSGNSWVEHPELSGVEYCKTWGGALKKGKTKKNCNAKNNTKKNKPRNSKK